MTLCSGRAREVLLVGFAAAVAWLVPETRAADEMAKARQSCESACQAARTKLLGAFDAKLDDLAKAGLNSEHRLTVYEVVTKERARFDKDGLLPWSEAMRPFGRIYLESTRRAESALRRAFGRAIAAHQRANDDDRVAELQNELSALVQPKVVARWKHFAQNVPIRLYSNGKINNADAKETWTVKHDRLMLRWPHPDAPGGTWIDDCRISSDGSQYLGWNQIGVRISGTYVESD